MNTREHRIPWSVLIACAVASGCASTPPTALSPAPETTTLAVSARAASPSPATSTRMPSAANYYLALGQRGDLGLLVSSSDGRIWGRLYLDAGSIDGQIHLAFEREGFDNLALEARGGAGVLDGTLDTDALAVSWRAASDASGQLHGQRWSAHGGNAESCAQIHDVHALLDDLRELGPTLADAAAWSGPDRQALVERLALAELALELSERACERRDRADLPKVTGPFAWR